ncbi:unnamed protein product [Diatraea saccharalis]|uniref:Peptidoglycan recognition protein family domain-containing protein n=1 Tax=Diatraea saccharalis TaxID=40085 RepID=A0A9N9N130_9NEOP|nr:unnamed protein product [Diatraea saccharalis]
MARMVSRKEWYGRAVYFFDRLSGGPSEDLIKLQTTQVHTHNLAFMLRIKTCVKFSGKKSNKCLDVLLQTTEIVQDHDSRHSSYHQSEELGEPSITEDTPLLRRFPPLETAQRSPLTTVIVSFLIIILLSGVVIGIYLLILQSRAENVLPPVDMPLQYVSRLQWAGGESPRLSMYPRMASQVIVVHTETEQCYTIDTCTELLQNMLNKTEGSRVTLPYNFLISSNGQMYEALGWRSISPLFPQHASSSLVLAFIGKYLQQSLRTRLGMKQTLGPHAPDILYAKNCTNLPMSYVLHTFAETLDSVHNKHSLMLNSGDFSNSPPTAAQLAEANNFFAESISRRHLSSSYVLFGKRTKESPKYLYLSMQSLPQWRQELTD